LLKQAGNASDITVHFIYSHRDEFIPKVEAKIRSNGRSGETKLWPDENAPAFRKYKLLVRAAWDGKADDTRKALEDGAPFSWPDNPVDISPLEYTAARNHELAFDELMKALPVDYSTYMYGHCIQVASQEGHTNILTKLLAKPQADMVPSRLLPEIFYSACYSAKIPAALEILLKHYPVGIDFRVRDYGHTLLFVAVQGRNHATVEWLLNHGANKNVTLKSGSKLIDWARDEQMRELLTRP
jgi:ankyrin repeat protein